MQKHILLFAFFLFAVSANAQNGNPRQFKTKPYVAFYKGDRIFYLPPGSAGQVIKMGAGSDTSLVWGTDISGSVTDGVYGEITVAAPNWTINSGAVVAAKIASNAVTAAKIASNAVDSSKLANRSVWGYKINQMGASSGHFLGWTGTDWAPSFPFSGASNRIPYFSGVNSLSNSGNFTYDNTNTWLNLNTYTSGNNGGYAGLQAQSSSGTLFLRSGNSVASNTVEGGSVILSRGGSSVLGGNCTTNYDYLGAIHAQAYYSSAFRESAAIQFRGDSTASTYYSGKISFYTSDGTSTAAERVQINRIGNLGVGTTNPLYRLDVAGTGGARFPSGTTAQRPTGAVGVMRFNTTTGNAEGVRSGSSYENFIMGTASTIYIGTSPSLDFPSMAQGTGSVLTFSDANAAPGDVISVGNPFSSGGSYTFSAGCSTSGTIWINVISWGAGSNDPSASTFKYTITK